MAVFQSKLLRKEDVAQGIMAFYLEKPEGFSYIPGQHATFKILKPAETDEEGNSRTFSFVTIPSEPEIAFTTRMRDSAFKRTLKNAEGGLEIEIINPRGTMILPTETSRPLVFLAGGIGITPFISMIKQATETVSKQKIFLFHSNKTKAESPFFAKLQEIGAKNPNFTFIPTLTQEEWEGEKGHITKEMLQKYAGDLQSNTYYLAGPVGMVNSMMELLAYANIDSQFIVSEDFGEYK